MTANGTEGDRHTMQQGLGTRAARRHSRHPVVALSPSRAASCESRGAVQSQVQTASESREGSYTTVRPGPILRARPESAGRGPGPPRALHTAHRSHTQTIPSLVGFRAQPGCSHPACKWPDRCREFGCPRQCKIRATGPAGTALPRSVNKFNLKTGRKYFFHYC